VFARLKPGVTAEDAESALRPWFAARLEAESREAGFQAVPAERRRAFLASTIDVLPAARGVSNLRGLLERPLLVLMAGTALLLLLTCLNVGGLLLARGASRGGELSTRIALGASRRRLTGQLLVESTLISVGGGVLGLLAAPAVSRILLSFLTYADDIPLRFDRRAFLFALIASGLTAALCGLAPLIQTGRLSLAELLKSHSRSTPGGRVRLRKALVAAQMAFTLLLLTGAGLFVQTVRHLQAQTGFPAGSQVLFSVAPTAIGYTEPDAEQAMRDVLRRVRETPGVESAALANTSLLSGGWSTRNLTIQSEERSVSDRPVPFMRVSPGFFATLGAQVIAGRDFDERDVRLPGSAPRNWQSVIVNESFVQRYFNGRNPVGSRLGVGDDPNTTTDIEIIGVVRDFSRRSLRDGAIEQAFFPYWDRDSDGGTFYVSVRGNPGAVFSAIRAAVEQVDPALPVSAMITLANQVERSIWTERAVARLVTAFGVIALLLSVIGLYGVMSFVVTQRRREVGIRIALGATRSATLWLVTRDALTMTGTGIALAIPAAWALRRIIESQLFGVRAFDVPTIALAVSVLVIVSLGAAIRPAWRAASMGPAEALRLE
jgi:predicted permease